MFDLTEKEIKLLLDACDIFEEMWIDSDEEEDANEWRIVRSKLQKYKDMMNNDKTS